MKTRARSAPRPAAGVDNPTTLNDPGADAQDRAPRDAALILLLGPVGAGKSTFARKLAVDRRALRLTLDEWMTRLFSHDRPASDIREWYVERAARCVDQIWTVAKDIVEIGSNVVLEIGLIRRDEREAFYRRVDDAGLEMTTYVLEADREIRRQRVEERNRARGTTFSMVVPPNVFELASDLWESLTPSECEGRDVRFVRTDVGGGTSAAGAGN